jgi:hypothetical protein
VGIILGLRGCWLKGPGARPGEYPDGIRMLTDPLWALISIPFVVAFKVALVTGVIYGLVYFVLRAAERNQPTEISHLEASMHRMNEIADEVGKI